MNQEFPMFHWSYLPNNNTFENNVTQLMNDKTIKGVDMVEDMDIEEDTRLVEEVIDLNILTMKIIPIDNTTIHILGHS